MIHFITRRSDDVVLKARAMLADLDANRPQPQPGLIAQALSALKQLFRAEDSGAQVSPIEAMSLRKKAGVTVPHTNNATSVRLRGGPHDGEYRFMCRSIDTITLEDTDGFRYRYVRGAGGNFDFAPNQGAQGGAA